jgi:hypothetical protein
MEPVAKFFFTEEHTHKGDLKSLEKKSRGNHKLYVNERWFAELKRQAGDDGNDAKVRASCRDVLRQVNHIRDRIRFFRHQSTLGQIQSEIGNQLNLLDDKRVFECKADVLKLIGTSTEPRVAFLFSDLFMYASKGSWSGLSNPRALNLTLSTLADVKRVPQGLFAFEIINPQKSFTVAFRSADECRTWRENIQRNINLLRAARLKIIRAVIPEGDGNLRRNSSFIDECRRLSTFLGTPQDNKSKSQHCALCLNAYGLSFKMFKRQKTCGICGTQVCDKCASHKIIVERRSKVACDACFLHFQETKQKTN